jgi:hypothetical protein
VKKPENEQMSENGRVGGEIGPQKGEKGGSREEAGLFSGQNVEERESAKQAL